MKKKLFLITPVLALLMAGCISSGTPCMKADGDSHSNYALTNTRTPRTLNGNETRGVRVSLSPRSSVNIDVECILDYVQGGPVDTPEFETTNHLYPWFRFEFAY